ncbi:hypothetical protein [Streptobacillus moniliformis]|uniref:hypothetical protein n=1 Tax=Streptobacillus moniliformis TaxID=34105 RepID=UPI0007E31559|nr:hypothetical protein [Streptobacillus moniliformis]
MILSIGDKGRGAVDGLDFKQYFSGVLLYRIISENITEFFNFTEYTYNNLDFDYAEIIDEIVE